MCSCEQYSCQQVEASEFPGAHGASVPVPHRTSWLTLRPPVCLPQCCWALWTPSDGPWYSLPRGILITSRRRAGRLAGLRCTPALRLVPVPWVLVRHPVKSRSEEPLCLLTRDTRSHGHKVGLPLLSPAHGDLSETARSLRPCPLSQASSCGTCTNLGRRRQLEGSAPLGCAHVIARGPHSRESHFSLISRRQTLSLRPYPRCSDRCGFLWGTCLLSLSWRCFFLEQQPNACNVNKLRISTRVQDTKRFFVL